MNWKGLAISMGLGVAAGAVGVMLLPQNNPTRKLAQKAASKLETVAWKVSDRLSQDGDFI